MWHRPTPNELRPSSTALLVFDMLEIYRSALERSGVLPTVVGLVDFCRDNGVLVCFARADHRPDGADYTRVIADTDRDFVPWTDERPQPVGPGHADRDGYGSLAELRQGPADIDVPKHRWSAFHGTALDLTLRVQQIETLLVVGGSTHVGVASTVYAARDLDYQVVVVRDGCTGHQEQRDLFLNTVFPRMVQVKTTAEVTKLLSQDEDRR
ncbi:MAG TPA: cysteine hydrolase [Pseudonocardiaceae bacterium]|nr:cysteine hydrolase [Pseudonocardiaceae bacterium]